MKSGYLWNFKGMSHSFAQHKIYIHLKNTK